MFEGTDVEGWFAVREQGECVYDPIVWIDGLNGGATFLTQNDLPAGNILFTGSGAWGEYFILDVDIDPYNGGENIWVSTELHGSGADSGLWAGFDIVHPVEGEDPIVLAMGMTDLSGYDTQCLKSCLRLWETGVRGSVDFYAG